MVGKCALGLEPTDIADSDSCARCGGRLVDAHCQACERNSESMFVHREIVVLVVLSTLVAVGFVLTRAADGANRAHRLRDAAAWYDAGERYLAVSPSRRSGRCVARRRSIAIAARTVSSWQADSLRIDKMREVADLMLTRDPLRPGLTLRQRQERVLAGFRRALAVLDDCANKQPANSGALESLRAEASELEPKLALERVRRTPESIGAGLNLIHRVEQRTVEMCGQGSAFDRALLLMGRRHEADRQ